MQQRQYIKGMSINKAPGINSLTVELFKELWVEIQDLTLDSLNESYTKGKISYLQRKGVIILIFNSDDAM